MSTSDLYLKITDKSGKSHIGYFRAWDKAKLITSQQAQHAKEGGRVELATEADYVEYRRAQRSA